MTEVFLIRLSAGIAMMWMLMPRAAVTDGFFRIQLRVVLGLAVLTALLLSSGTRTEIDSTVVNPSMLPAETTFWLQCTAAAIAYPGSIFWALGRRTAGNAAIVGLFATCLASLIVVSLSSSVGPLLQVFAGISSALVLGSVMTGMLLGHWYLTSPTMSIRPLRVLMIWIAIAAVSRLTATVLAFATHGALLHETTQVIWFVLRIAGACAAPAIAAVLSHQVLKYRNTQSATGILFACLILVFMGEMSASLLEGDLGVPF